MLGNIYIYYIFQAFPSHFRSISPGCNVLLRPPQPSASQPLSPKETLTLPGRLPSPNGRPLVGSTIGAVKCPGKSVGSVTGWWFQT